MEVIQHHLGHIHRFETLVKLKRCQDDGRRVWHGEQYIHDIADEAPA